MTHFTKKQREGTDMKRRYNFRTILKTIGKIVGMAILTAIWLGIEL